MSHDIAITRVKSPEDVASTVPLLEAYAQTLARTMDIDITAQDFDTDMFEVPAKYASPAGALFVARDSSHQSVGCVALQPFPKPGFCEMKRLYVAPRGRGLGLGRTLAMTAIEEARRLDYRTMLLGTLAGLTAARALYKSLGFVEIEQYYDTPNANTIFLQLDLCP